MNAVTAVTREPHRPPLVAVVGPTASGKTGFGVALAKALGGEVVSCDSMQLYRGMEIGTAAPTPEEQEGVPHHLVGILSPTERFSAADYCERAGAVVAEILARGRLPILVGGTGLYLDALTEGRQFPEQPDTGELRARLFAEAEQPGGAEALHARLASLDREAANAIHPNNVKRVVRALEVCLTSGRPFSEVSRETSAGPSPYHLLRLGLDYRDRQRLYDRIDLRVELMWQQGLLQEAEQLMALPGIEGSTAFQAIGYKELLPLLRGEGTKEEAVAAIQQASRRYAKRQRTWFARHRDTHWFFRDEQSDEEILRCMTALTEDHLRSFPLPQRPHNPLDR